MKGQLHRLSDVIPKDLIKRVRQYQVTKFANLSTYGTRFVLESQFYALFQFTQICVALLFTVGQIQGF